MVCCVKRLIIFLAGFSFIMTLLGCATKVDPLSENLSLEGYFQKGNEAMDKNWYDVALRYYQAAQQKYPENINGKIWASYEIAFIYHKMRNDTKAVELYNQLIALYKENDKNDYPRAPLILAEKVKARIESKSNKNQTKTDNISNY